MKTGNIQILLVEDNPDDVELTLDAFRDNHLVNRIIVARDGEEALEVLEKEKVDMILLDLKLPKIGGVEILRRVKSNSALKRIPVIVLTSSREEKDLVESYQLGVNSYILKPVDFEKFRETVSQIGLYWLLLNEYPGK